MDYTEIIASHKERNFSEKVNATFGFIRANKKSMFRSLLFIVGPFAVLASLCFSNAYVYLVSYSNFGRVVGEDNNILGLSVLGIILLLLVGGIVIIAAVNSFVLLYDHKQSTQITVSEVWLGVKANFFKIFGGVLLFILAIIVSYFVMLIPGFLLAFISPVLIFILMLGIYVVLFFIFIVFLMSSFIAVYERLGIDRSVTRCLFLMRDHWWATFGYLLFMLFMLMFASIAFAMPMYLFTAINAFHNTSTYLGFNEPMWYSIINGVLTIFYFVGSFLAYAVLLIAIAYQYFNLVEKKEAKGLLAAIDAMGTELDTTEDEEYY